MSSLAPRIVVGSLVLVAASALLFSQTGMSQQGAGVPRPSAKLYNAAKQKLFDGKQVSTHTP